MSEENATVEPITSAASPEVQAEAEAMGWIPPSRFHGEADKFIDAEAYLERGKTVLPIVKQQLEKTRSELAALRVASAEQARLVAKLHAAQEEAEMRFTVEKQKAVEQARADLKAELAAASERGDHAAVAELTAELTENAQAMKDLKTGEKPKEEEEKKSAAAAAAEDPDFIEWRNENSWYAVDRRKTALALGIAEDLRASGDKTVGKAFYAKISEELNKTLGVKPPSGDKVQDGARNGGGSGGATGGYNKLPADAKAACDAEAKRFVGPGKKFKTDAEWRGHYASIYFQS